MRIYFNLTVVLALLWAPLAAFGDAEPRSSVDLTLMLSTDVGGNEAEPAKPKPAAGRPEVSKPARSKAATSHSRSSRVVQETVAQTGSTQPAGDPADTYRIDTGDGISITVYGEPDLSVKDERVKGNGKISYPLLGDIEVRGRTASQLQQQITEMLSDGYLKKPNVTVSVDTFRLFYIKGEVRNPGGFNYVDGLTVEKAVALAGGYTERASERNITVVRDGDLDRRARQASPGTRIRPGDVITVGESFF